MRRGRRAHKLIDRAQPFAEEPLLAVANFTWVGNSVGTQPGVRGRADWAGGFPDWTLIGAGPSRLWIVEAHRMRPDAGASLIGSWPLSGIRMTEERHPRKAGPIPLGSWRAMRFEFPDRGPAILQPFGREADAVLEAVDASGSGVRWQALVQVALITSPHGPSDEDVFFALTYDDETTTFLGLGESEVLLPRLQALPGFDNATFAAAIGSREEVSSVLWRRPV